MIDDVRDYHFRKEILQRLHDVEEECNIRILYAVDAGDRAWGIASNTDDYEIYFIYAHPKEWYLSINPDEQSDIVDYELFDDIQIHGCDIRRALKLLRISDPVIVEWLNSPLVFIDDGYFARQAREILNKVYSSEKLLFHYRSTAWKNAHRLFKNDALSAKKYLLILRPLLLSLWIRTFNSLDSDSIQLSDLCVRLEFNEVVKNEIFTLLKEVHAYNGGEIISAIKVINDFVLDELSQLDLDVTSSQQDNPYLISEINSLFRAAIDRIYSDEFTGKQYFHLRKEEQPIIQSLISLGDWICNQPGISTSDQRAVIDLQKALHDLPDITPNLSISYSFDADDKVFANWDGEDPIPKGVKLSWNVDYCSKSGRLEIYNFYFQYPDKHYDITSGWENEVSISCYAEDYRYVPLNHNRFDFEYSQCIQKNWVQAIASPEAYKRSGMDVDYWISS